MKSPFTPPVSKPFVLKVPTRDSDYLGGKVGVWRYGTHHYVLEVPKQDKCHHGVGIALGQIQRGK